MYLRRPYLGLAIMLMFALPFACKKDKQKKEITIEYPYVFIDIMEIDTKKVDTLVERTSFEFPTYLQGELEKNNTSKELIKSAKLTSMRLQIMDYAYEDTTNVYCNFKDISELYLDILHDDIGQKNVAFKTNIPDEKLRIINMDMADVELKEYLKKDVFKFVAKYKKRRAMPHQMPYTIKLIFKIIADSK